MKFYHVAPEKELTNLFSHGIKADEAGGIILIRLKEDFILKKFIFDVYAFEELKIETYCAFEVSPHGIASPLMETAINSIFSDSYRFIKQDHIDSNYLKLFKYEETYEGMGLAGGVMPVEHKDKFTDVYKRKVLEYLKEVVSN